MPLYEYECDSCGNRFERIQKFSDPPIDKCPQCGGVVRKLISSPAIQFKGSGWYITDYARKAEKPDAAANADGSKSASEAPARPADEGSSPKTSKESKEAAKEPAASPKPAEKSTPGSNS
jgi:putative FmdB family regulatory protein